jgi:hypothetical protein
MMPDRPGPERRRPAPWLGWLERITAAVLAAVLLALGWMVLAARLPESVRLPWPEVEIGVVLTLLAAALVLVSVVALLHTRH